MGEANQAHTREGGSEWITNHPLAAAIIVYTLVSIPVYFWLEGPVGIAGTVDGSVAAAGLVFGAIMFVPIIKVALTNWLGASRVRPVAESE